ncbi:MAG: D-alanyl-D-alanine carboxypeptidase/D-alanyl-D-alanine-endopeptidase [Acidobacteriota bacterium]|nr:D-alanyl-D-alanine carboxypeptidase/D-alanyl-D-alanine-endopeptidase [Acidobacteriota bacterium]
MAFFLLALTFSGCYSTSQQQQAGNSSDSNGGAAVLPDAGGDAPFEIPAPDINLANPLVVSQRAEDVALCEKINRRIDESQFANARWGVFAVSLKDGRVVCSRDGRKLFNPASIQKTLTAIVALDKLGADFRWKTSVYSENQIEADGTLGGSLTLYGEGAPDFDAAALENLAAQLQAKGLRRVKGGITGDESYFRGDTIGDGWTWNELQWYYGAEASALTFNDNQAFINVENGAPRTSTDYIQVTIGKPPAAAAENNAGIEASGIKRGLSDNNFYVWGNAKNFGARVAVHNPAGLAAKNLKEALEKKGIAIEGEIRSRDWKADERLDTANARELASVQSATLGEIVRKMNKHSVNLYAELILRTIGKRFSDTVPGDIQRPQNVRGDDTAGAALIKQWLRQHNVATEEIEIYDGSGLSRLDFVTPESFGRALIYAAQSPFAQVFTDSLPIAATDGTLGGRLAKVKGKVLAKTGSITFVNSLAGYADSAGGEVLAFVVITNNDTRRNGTVGVIDAVTTILVTGTSDEKEAQKETKTANNNQQNNNANNANQPNFVLRKKAN